MAKITAKQATPAKTTQKTSTPAKPTPAKTIQKILITQAKPENDKSPYFDVAKKYKVQIDFQPFIKVEGIPAREFRKQKIDIPAYSAVIFTSRNAIDHFFRTCEEMKITVSQHTKYFCITEAVALYLQKFILYRKRKVFYGADGTNKSLFEVINKHKESESFLFPCSESLDNEIITWLKDNNCEFATPVVYKIVSADVKDLLAKNKYDVICLFTPGGVKSLLENSPGFKKNGTHIGAFGESTLKTAIAAGLNPDIKAPQPKAPSMVSALDQFLATAKKK
jgi:uroporphyrinogen-III synthase